MGRVRRFLEAQNRPTIYEDFGTAVRYGRPACVRRWLVGGPKACSSGSESPDVLDRLAQDLGDGAPTATYVLARLGWDRGEAYWRLGEPNRALKALWMTIPPSIRPAAPPKNVRVKPWSEPPMTFTGAPPIGDPGQNLFLGARLLYLAGQTKPAEGLDEGRQSVRPS